MALLKVDSNARGSRNLCGLLQAQQTEEAGGCWMTSSQGIAQPCQCLPILTALSSHLLEGSSFNRTSGSPAQRISTSRSAHHSGCEPAMQHSTLAFQALANFSFLTTIMTIFDEPRGSSQIPCFAGCARHIARSCPLRLVDPAEGLHTLRVSCSRCQASTSHEPYRGGAPMDTFWPL